MTALTCSNRDIPDWEQSSWSFNTMFYKTKGPGKCNLKYVKKFNGNIWLHPPHCLDELTLKSAWQFTFTHLISCDTQTGLRGGQQGKDHHSHGIEPRLNSNTGKPGPPTHAFNFPSGVLSQAGGDATVAGRSGIIPNIKSTFQRSWITTKHGSMVLGKEHQIISDISLKLKTQVNKKIENSALRSPQNWPLSVFHLIVLTFPNFDPSSIFYWWFSSYFLFSSLPNQEHHEIRAFKKYELLLE